MRKHSRSQELSNIPPDDTERFFCSHDIGLIGYLLSKNFELVGLDKTVRNKVLFNIKRRDDLDLEIKKYWDFKSSVDAQSYFNQIKRLKNQIFSSD